MTPQARTALGAVGLVVTMASLSFAAVLLGHRIGDTTWQLSLDTVTLPGVLRDLFRKSGRPLERVLDLQPVLSWRTEVTTVNLKALQSGLLDQNIALRDGDTIFVPRAETVYVFGQVKNPGSYSVQKATTVLQALSLAERLSRSVTATWDTPNSVVTRSAASR